MRFSAAVPISIPSRVGLAVFLFGVGCGGAEVGSIGAVLARDTDSGRILVEEAPEGLAAANGGIERGDELISVDGARVADLGAEELRARLRGAVGSEVRVTLARGDRVLRLTLKRTALGRPAPTARPSVERMRE